MNWIQRLRHRHNFDQLIFKGEGYYQKGGAREILKAKQMEVHQCTCGKIKYQKNTPEGRASNKKASDISALKSRGSKKSKEECDVLSIALKNKWAEEEYRDKMLKIRAKQWTTKARNNMSKSSIIRMSRLEEIEKNRDRMNKRFENDDYRKSHSIKISKAVNEGRCGYGKAHKGWVITKSNGVVFYASSYELRMINVLEDNNIFWKKCSDKISYRDIADKPHHYTPDFKIFDGDNFFYIETKGYVDLDTFNKLNYVSLYSNEPIYLLFNKDITYLENTNQPIDFTVFKTTTDFVSENYFKYWGNNK